MSKKHKSQKQNKIKARQKSYIEARQKFIEYKKQRMENYYHSGTHSDIELMNEQQFQEFEKTYEEEKNRALEQIRNIIKTGEILGKIVASQSVWVDDDFIFYQITKTECDPVCIEMKSISSTYDEENKTFYFEKDKFQEPGWSHVLHKDSSKIGVQNLYFLVTKEYFSIGGGELIMIDSDSQYTIPEERSGFSFFTNIISEHE